MEADSFSYGNLIMYFTRIGEVNSFWRYDISIVRGLKQVFSTLLLVLLICLPRYSLAIECSGETSTNNGKISDAPPDRKLIFDLAQVLSEQQLTDLENTLTWYNGRFSTTFKVVLVKSIGTITMQEFTYQLEEKYGIVTHQSNRIILVIETSDNKSRIDYSADLNQFIHDDLTDKILEQIDSYYLKNALYQEGIKEAINKLSFLVETEKAEVYDAELKQRKLEEKQSRGIGASVFFVLLMFILFLIFRKSFIPKRKKYKGNFGSSGTRKWGSFGGSDDEDRSWQDNSTF